MFLSKIFLQYFVGQKILRLLVFKTSVYVVYIRLTRLGNNILIKCALNFENNMIQCSIFVSISIQIRLVTNKNNRMKGIPSNCISKSIAKSTNYIFFRDQFSDISGKLKESVEDLSKNEKWKKASEFTENFSKSTAKAGESLGKAAENISQTNAFKSATNVASYVK